MLDMTKLVELSADQITQLTEASAAKADAYAEARQGIAARFDGQSRISLGTLLEYLDKAETDYRAGADPSYWQRKDAEPATKPEPAAAPTKGRAVKDAPQA
jgi:hypothetical protein